MEGDPAPDVRPFPTSLEEIGMWRKRNGVTAEESRRRFAQFVILDAIASAAGLSRDLAFKGGNALRFIYGSRRSTLDLDFTAVATFPDDSPGIRTSLDQALRASRPRHRLRAKCQRVKRNPPGEDKTRPTYSISVAYALPADRLYNNFDESSGVPSVVGVEISFNEVICEVIPRRLHPAGAELTVCSLEDIVAEKLRALLQQPARNRSRPQDVFDIPNPARRFGRGLDLSKVSIFLIEKSLAREIAPKKSDFNDSIKERASFDYEVQVGTNTPNFIPFEEAWAELLAFVSGLSIPS